MTNNEFKTRIKNFFLVRFHMGIIVLGTWGGGLLTNKLLFQLGLDSMVVRYFFALLVSYGIFLLFIRLWLHYVFGYVAKSSSLENAADSVEVVNMFTNLNFKTAESSPTWSGGGGKFSGGGAQGSWGASESKIELKDLDVGDDGGALLVGILAILSVFIMVVFAVLLVINAPTFLSDLAVEMALSLGLLKGLNKDKGDWLIHAFRKTKSPFLILMVFFIIFAGAAEYYYPEAHTLIDVWNRVLTDSKAFL